MDECQNEELYHDLKTSENYKILNSNMGQQILKEVCGCCKSFSALCEEAEKGNYESEKVRLPRYLPKDGFTTLVIGQVRLNGNKLLLPYSLLYKKSHKPIEITIPPILADKKIKEIRIVPKSNARFFEIQYIYVAEQSQRKLDPNNVLVLDIGLDNFATGVTNKGKSFILDGRNLKSKNQLFNKENARLQSIKDKQGLGKTPSKRQAKLSLKRANQVRDFVGKAVKWVIKFCVDNNIGTLVVGYNKGFQQSPCLGRVTNQNFVNIPYGKFRRALACKCELNGIAYIEQEESYTSKASFFDADPLPVYGDKDIPKFSGKRVHRGLYKTSSGQLVNADVNGALNILRKSKVACLDALYSGGVVDTPKRIRLV